MAAAPAPNLGSDCEEGEPSFSPSGIAEGSDCGEPSGIGKGSALGHPVSIGEGSGYGSPSDTTEGVASQNGSGESSEAGVDASPFPQTAGVDASPCSNQQKGGAPRYAVP